MHGETNMQPETYTLMHRMFCVASTKRELEIVLQRFTEIFEGTKNSANRDDRFDAAWARSCMAGLYVRLNEPYLAELTYREAIERFDQDGMSNSSATFSVALAAFLMEQGRQTDAEAMLEQNIVYLIRYWRTGNRHVISAEEELMHFQRTGQMIEAVMHDWCRACNIDHFGIGFDFEDTDKAEL